MLQLVWLLYLLRTCLSQTATTNCGEVAGFQESGVNVFLGIPYATPPINALRWQNSRKLDQCWSGVLDGTSFGSECVQGGPSDSEDCLFLNVWTPTLTPAKPLPVLFFIHGGGFNTGNGELDGAPFILASNNSVVLVTINYRLNGFGFLALKELSNNSATKTSGNYGVSDMITALKWVHANIAHFGGNQHSVTIFGQSSGGTGVLMLLISPLATGLFHKAILLSASTRVDADLAYAEAQNRIFVENANCNNASSVLQCLYNLTADDVFDALPWTTYPYWGHDTDFSLPVLSFGDGAMLGIVDGHIVPDNAVTALTSKRFSDVPVIFGSMADEVDFDPGSLIQNYTESEYNAFITASLQPWNDSGLITGALEFYSLERYLNLPQLAYDAMASDIHTTCGQSFLADVAASAFQSPVYRYIVSQWPSAPVCFGYPFTYCPQYAFHAWDLLSLFEEYPPDFNVTANDEALTDSLQSYFFQLAHNGTLDSAWPTVNSQGRHHTVDLNFNIPNRVEVDYHKAECHFWWSHNFAQYSWNS